MSSTQDAVKCPQCGNPANREVDHDTNGHYIGCTFCGYCDNSYPEFDEDGKYCGWNHEISAGFGVLEYALKHDFAAGYVCYLDSREEVLDAEQWLREALDTGELEAGTLTRWNPEIKQVEFIVGEPDEGHTTNPPEWDDSTMSWPHTPVKRCD